MAITNDILIFLEELKNNNHKEWFQSQKKRYDLLRSDFIEFTTSIIQKCAAFDKDLEFLEAKKCIFRINRDVRFSKDKSPYKTNFGLYLAKGGKNLNYAGYYLHLDPEESFLAGGLYLPDNKILKEVREEIHSRYDEFLAIINAPAFKKHFGEISGDKLINAPKGFDKDFEGVEYLKLKSLLMYKKLNHKELEKKDLDNFTSEIFSAMLPLNTFFNRVITDIA